MPRNLTAILIAAAGIRAWPALGSPADPPAERSVSLAQDPLVMRLSKDEFRIAFGVNAQGCVSNGCNGVIQYTVEWKTEDGTVISEFKRVSYNVLPHSMRTMTVDRQYFDTAEGAHTTNVVKVTVDMITCVDGAYANSTPPAHHAPIRCALHPFRANGGSERPPGFAVKRLPARSRPPVDGMTYALPTQIPKDASMNLAIPLSPHMGERSPHSEASPEGRSLPAPRWPCIPPEDPLEELIEMRYQQYLAERELWNLFENGELQTLET